MRKTLLAAFISASVFALPAFAQVSLGGAGHLGGSVTAGGALNGAMRTPGALGAQVQPAMQRLDHHARHATRHAVQQSRSTLDRHGNARVDASASASPHADAAGHRADAGVGVRGDAGVDSAAVVDPVAGRARGAGQQVNEDAHAAVRDAHRTTDSVGQAARQAASAPPMDAHANARANVDEHGH